MAAINSGEVEARVDPEGFIDGRYPVLSENLTVLSGQVLEQFEVVAKETSSAKIVKYDGGGSGGAEVAYGITADAIDATGADANGLIYLWGAFNKNKLMVTAEAALMFDQLRERGIIVTAWASP